MSEGIKEQVRFTPEEMARAAFSSTEDARFSWKELRRNAARVEPFASYVVHHSQELVADALGRATEFLSVTVASREVRVNLVCGSPWDAFVLFFEQPELFFDVAFYADAPLDKTLPDFRSVLAHELWHLAFRRHQAQHWERNYPKSTSPSISFLYEMLNEGVGHYYSMSQRLYPRPGWGDFTERERAVFSLLEKNYLLYLAERDPQRRKEILFRSHAGVPFWQKWGAVPGALVIYHLKAVLGTAGLRRLIGRDPFSVFVAYDQRRREHPDWPPLPRRLVEDARREQGARPVGNAGFGTARSDPRSYRRPDPQTIRGTCW
jgi:hypothetical protein